MLWYSEDMEIILHVIIALASVGYATYTCISPSKRRLQATYALAALTVASGCLLVIDGAHMLQVCVTGLVYLLGMSCAVFIARIRLAASAVRSTK